MASTMTARYVSSFSPSSMQPNPIDSALLNLSTLNRNSNGYYSDLEEKIEFQIRLSDPSMSVNDISVEVENLGEPAEVNVHAFSHQEAEVTVTPHERVQHKITVRYNGQIVNGSPFNVMIYPELETELEHPIPSLETLTLSKPKQGERNSNGVHRDFNVIRSTHGTIHLSTNGNSVMLGDEHEVYLDVSEAGEGDLSVEVSNGRRNLPIQTILNGNGYTIRILAKSVGVYNVYISWNGKFISENPLKLIVHDRGKVSVYGDGIDKALVGHPASFIVDSRAYGDGVLKAKVKGPTSRAKTSIAENPDGTHTIMYVPLEAGLHTISVFLSEKEITGSPFIAEVKEKKVKQPSAVFAVSTRNYEPARASNSFVTTTKVDHNVPAIADENAIVVFGDGLTSVLEGQIAGFVIDPRNASAGGDLTIQITGPNSFAKCNVLQNQDGTLTATYVPGEVGTFIIDISWSGKRIKGSPFRAEASNPSKISLCGQQNGNIPFEVGRPNVIEFDTSSAGKGVLTAFIDGPVGQHMNVMIERGQRSSIITYNPPVEGEYKLHILWSGNPIPNSPFYIISENRRDQIDLTRIHVTNLMRDMVVNGTYEFVIDGSGVEYGVPSAYMQGFSENIPIQIVSLRGNVYTATFTPKHTGAYLLHVKWSGHEIPGSPFSVSVNEMKPQVFENATSNSFQRSMGTKLPSTLRTGKAYSLTIDANEVGGAKIGEMAVTCDGPTSSVPVQIRDNFNNTFDIMLTPSEIGSHLLNIKVNGSHIEGSPFSFDVSGAYQVSCFGQGLAGGPLSTYDSSFQCDTRTAGAGQLKVRAYGPKGAFNVEILPSLKNRRILNVKFHPSTKGVYTLNVQWNDEHVPGSPFKIKLT